MNYPNKYDITKFQILHAYLHMDVLVAIFCFFKTSKFARINTICCVSYSLGHSYYGQITINIQCDSIQISKPSRIRMLFSCIL